MAMTEAGKNRIMIFGPKADGHLCYRVQDGRRRGAGDIDPENRDGSDPALPRAYALWPLRAGYSVRNLCCPRCFQRTLLPPICHREDVFLLFEESVRFFPNYN